MIHFASHAQGRRLLQCNTPYKTTLSLLMAADDCRMPAIER